MFGWMEKQGRGAQRMGEISGAADGMLITQQAGFVSGTHVASNLGWRRVDALCVGDKVLTFDHGMQTIVDIHRETLFAPEHTLPPSQRPVLVPAGAMNNRTEMWLMPDQGLLVESDAAIDAMGDPFAVVPAKALEGFKGVEMAAPVDHLEITTLAFAHDEVIYVEGGMLAHCPRTRRILIDDPDLGEPLYDVLGLRDARFLVECLIAGQDFGAFTCDPEELSVLAHQRAPEGRPLTM